MYVHIQLSQLKDKIFVLGGNCELLYSLFCGRLA